MTENFDPLAPVEPVPAPATVRPLLELLTLPPRLSEEEREVHIQAFRKSPRPTTLAEQIYNLELSSARQTFAQTHPLGLPQCELDFSLAMPESPYQVIAAKIVEHAKLAKYLDSKYKISEAAGRKWMSASDLRPLRLWLKENVHRLRLWELAMVLNTAEIAWLFHHEEGSSDLACDILDHPIQTYIHRISRSAAHWQTPSKASEEKLPWSRVVDFHNFFRHFDFGIPDLQVTIEHTSFASNGRGKGRYTQRPRDAVTGIDPSLFLDGEFALVIAKDGRHLLTIGVSASHAGLLVNQIQLKEHKGNRWLFKLPKPYFEYAIERLQAACQAAKLPMFLVTGQSLTDEINRQHIDGEKPLDQATAERIARTYDQPLVGFERLKKTIKVKECWAELGHSERKGLSYHELKAR